MDMDAPEVVLLGELSLLEIPPGAILVLSPADPLSGAQMNYYRQRLNDLVPHCKDVLILPAGCSLGALREVSDACGTAQAPGADPGGSGDDPQ